MSNGAEINPNYYWHVCEDISASMSLITQAGKIPKILQVVREQGLTELVDIAAIKITNACESAFINLL